MNVDIVETIVILDIVNIEEFPQAARYRPSRRGQGCAVSAATKRSARGEPKPVVMS
jgi:hypothetical protein